MMDHMTSFVCNVAGIVDFVPVNQDCGTTAHITLLEPFLGITNVPLYEMSVVWLTVQITHQNNKDWFKIAFGNMIKSYPKWHHAAGRIDSKAVNLIPTMFNLMLVTSYYCSNLQSCTVRYRRRGVGFNRDQYGRLFTFSKFVDDNMDRISSPSYHRGNTRMRTLLKTGFHWEYRASRIKMPFTAWPAIIRNG
jgi:hypothetical protein